MTIVARYSPAEMGTEPRRRRLPLESVRRGDPLAAREADLLALLAQGRRVAQAAAEVGVTPEHAGYLLRRARKKLGAATTTEAVVLARATLATVQTGTGTP